MIKPGDDIGGYKVLRAMNLPPERKPKYNPKTETIWQFPDHPGLWIVRENIPIDLETCDVFIKIQERFLDEACDESMSDILLAIENLKKQRIILEKRLND